MGHDSLHLVSAWVPSSRQEAAASCILLLQATRPSKVFQRTTPVTCKCLMKSRTSCLSIRLLQLRQSVLTIAVSPQADRQASSYSSRRKPTIRFKDGTYSNSKKRLWTIRYRVAEGWMSLRKENKRSEITCWKSTRGILRPLTQRMLLNRFRTVPRRPQPPPQQVDQTPSVSSRQATRVIAALTRLTTCRTTTIS